MKKAAISTLGCKVNQVESSSIVQQLERKGYQIVDFNTSADLYIINTCTVTNRSDYKSRNLIRKALKAKEINPEVKIIVTGCYAQKEQEEVQTLGNIDLIVDNQSKIDLDLWLENDEYAFRNIMQETVMNWKDVNLMHERTRAFIKIQDGCDYFCSYCAVPYGRGKSRSLSIAEVLKQVNSYIENGFKEIVLTGVNLGLYNDITSQTDLAKLLKVLVNIDSSIIFRISSLEPNLWTDDLLNVIEQNDNICPHFHIPLQSGSNNVLNKMGRKYDTELIEKLVTKLQTAKPDCAIGFDVICGFPVETIQDFETTYKFIKSLPISYLHVFTFSPRRGTPAFMMANQITKDVAKQRSDALLQLGQELKNDYMDKLIISRVNLKGVVESIDNNTCNSLSNHYIRIYKKDCSVSVNTFLEGVAVKRYKDGLLV